MKKFGTPTLAAPGVASVYRGFVRRGAAGAAGSGGVRRWALAAPRPCRSATRCWPWPSCAVAGLAVADSSAWSCCLGLAGAVLGLRACRVAAASGSRRRGRRGAWPVGVGGDRGRLRGGRRRRGRALGRAEVDDRGDRRGQARDLHLVDRRAGRDLDGHRQLLAGDERHAHVVHLGVRGGHEHARVEARTRRAQRQVDGVTNS